MGYIAARFAVHKQLHVTHEFTVATTHWPTTAYFYLDHTETRCGPMSLCATQENVHSRINIQGDPIDTVNVTGRSHFSVSIQVLTETPILTLAVRGSGGERGRDGNRLTYSVWYQFRTHWPLVYLCSTELNWTKTSVQCSAVQSIISAVKLQGAQRSRNTWIEKEQTFSKYQNW
jgi:hypothetical protein